MKKVIGWLIGMMLLVLLVSCESPTESNDIVSINADSIRWVQNIIVVDKESNKLLYFFSNGKIPYDSYTYDNIQYYDYFPKYRLCMIYDKSSIDEVNYILKEIRLFKNDINYTNCPVNKDWLIWGYPR